MRLLGRNFPHYEKAGQNQSARFGGIDIHRPGLCHLCGNSKIPVYEVDFPDMQLEVTPERIAELDPMVPAPRMTDEEAAAIWAYLQSIPVIRNPDLKAD
jgi:hypothetical protein